MSVRWVETFKTNLICPNLNDAIHPPTRLSGIVNDANPS